MFSRLSEWTSRKATVSGAWQIFIGIDNAGELTWKFLQTSSRDAESSTVALVDWFSVMASVALAIGLWGSAIVPFIAEVEGLSCVLDVRLPQSRRVKQSICKAKHEERRKTSIKMRFGEREREREREREGEREKKFKSYLRPIMIYLRMWTCVCVYLSESYCG